MHPPADLAPFISIAWILRWDLGEDAHVQRVLPDPCVQIVIDADGARVMGVVTGSFAVTLTGKHLVLGMKFRPGGFYPFLRQPVSSLTDRTVRLADCSRTLTSGSSSIAPPPATARASSDGSKPSCERPHR